MLIHLMQHGQCMPKEISPHQPLSPIGTEQVLKSARAAHMLGLRFELMVASPKTRSIQTAELMAQQTGYPVNRIQVTEAVKAMAEPKATLAYIMEYDGLDSVFIAGHLPSLARVASLLLTGSGKLDIAVENGGLMQINYDTAERHGVLNWHLSPAQLSLMAKS